MKYTATGKLQTKKVEHGTSKAGKPWSKMTFVIDATEDPKYPKIIAFDTFRGESIELINDTSDGSNLKVEFAVESREWNGKYFSNINAFAAEIVREGETNNYQQPAPPVENPSDDLPF